MKYSQIVQGIFVQRPNRFVAKVEINGKEEVVHVKNTGRCRELLVPGVKVFLEDFEGRMGTRKLRYSLIAVEKLCDLEGKKKLLVNMDSQAPNALIKEEFQKWVEKTGNRFRPEKTFKNSRFDFWFEKEGKEGFLEVKGVTLEREGFCCFPDAPTERGVKHLYELMEAKTEGYQAGVLFLVQMKGMKSFSPNEDTDPAFAEALRKAFAADVKILCYECEVTPDSLELGKKIPVKL